LGSIINENRHIKKVQAIFRKPQALPGEIDVSCKSLQ